MNWQWVVIVRGLGGSRVNKSIWVISHNTSASLVHALNEMLLSVLGVLPQALFPTSYAFLILHHFYDFRSFSAHALEGSNNETKHVHNTSVHPCRSNVRSGYLIEKNHSSACQVILVTCKLSIRCCAIAWYLISPSLKGYSKSCQT